MYYKKDNLRIILGAIFGILLSIISLYFQEPVSFYRMSISLGDVCGKKIINHEEFMGLLDRQSIQLIGDKKYTNDIFKFNYYEDDPILGDGILTYQIAHKNSDQYNFLLASEIIKSLKEREKILISLCKKNLKTKNKLRDARVNKDVNFQNNKSPTLFIKKIIFKPKILPRLLIGLFSGSLFGALLPKFVTRRRKNV